MEVMMFDGPILRFRSTPFKTGGFGTKYRSSGAYNPYKGPPKNRPGGSYPARQPSSYPSGGSFKPVPGSGPRPGQSLGSFLNSSNQRFAGSLGTFATAALTLFNADPGATRRAARELDAYLTQFLPDWWNLEWWEDLFSGWGKVKGGQKTSDYVLPAGWTTVCENSPDLHPEQPIWFVGVSPHSPDIVGYFCGNGGASAWNLAWGSDIPAGTVVVQMSQQNEVNPIRDGRTWKLASTSNGQPWPSVIPYRGGRTMPVADPFPAVQAAAELLPPVRPPGGRSGVYDFDFNPSRPGRPGKTDPPGPPAPRPPPPGVKEKKFMVGTGGPIGKAFGALTEFGDALDCAWKAAGGKGNMSMPNKVKFVAANYDISDPHMVAETIKCMALSQVSDLVVGKANQAATKQYIKSSTALGGRPARGVGIKRAPSPFGSSTRMS